MSALGAVLVLGADPAQLVDNVTLGVAPTWKDFILAIPIGMIAYTGIETISNMAEEAKDEIRTIPAAIKRVAIAVFATPRLLIYLHGPLDVIVQQCRRALAWVYRHIDGYNGNPERIHVCGHSAGGHLAASASNWSTNPKRVGPYRRYGDLLIDAYGEEGEDYEVSAEYRPPTFGSASRALWSS